MCTSCGYLSAVKSTLTAHIQRFHSGGQRLFKCELCLCAPAGLGPLPLSLALCDRHKQANLMVRRRSRKNAGRPAGPHEGRAAPVSMLGVV